MYNDLGCWIREQSRGKSTLINLEQDSRVSSFLDGAPGTRTDAIKKCYQAALRLGYGVFVVKDEGGCSISATAQEEYQGYVKHSGCANKGYGGGQGTIRIYEINGKMSQ